MSKKLNKKTLERILRKHKLWLEHKEGGVPAILHDADLYKADLSNVDLREADLSNANLSSANLSGANLYKTNLSGACLYSTNLYDANLFKANLNKAILCNSNLSNAKLCDADLYEANLLKANLHSAYLYGANLQNANLYGAILSKADLLHANLSGANLYKADLYEATLYGANLSNVDLYEASIYKANLYGAKNIPYIPMACPEVGSFIGWKKVGKLLIKLKITEDALRSSSTGRECRCNKAKVLAIEHFDGSPATENEIKSSYTDSFIYKIGETIEEPNFCTDRWRECVSGIYFFISKQEAISYMTR